MGILLFFSEGVWGRLFIFSLFALPAPIYAGRLVSSSYRNLLGQVFYNNAVLMLHSTDRTLSLHYHRPPLRHSLSSLFHTLMPKPSQMASIKYHCRILHKMRSLYSCINLLNPHSFLCYKSVLFHFSIFPSHSFLLTQLFSVSTVDMKTAILWSGLAASIYAQTPSVDEPTTTE